MIRAERLSGLDVARAAMPEPQAVVLRHIEDYSNPDIAAILACGVAAVESLTARAERRLAEILRDGGARNDRGRQDRGRQDRRRD